MKKTDTAVFSQKPTKTEPEMEITEPNVTALVTVLLNSPEKEQCTKDDIYLKTRWCNIAVRGMFLVKMHQKILVAGQGPDTAGV